MELQSPLYWHQGLFLQPQHFQLLERSLETQRVPAMQLQVPHFWGVRALKVKEAALGVRRFGLLHGRFLFPDGTYVDYPGNAQAEDRAFDDAWPQDGRPLKVYVGLKKWNVTADNVAIVAEGAPLSPIARRCVTSDAAQERRDLHSGGPSGQVKTLSYLLKIFWETELERLGDYDLIPVAQIERRGTEFVLADTFIPPCVAAGGSESLLSLLRDLSDQLLARSRQLEEHKRQRGLQATDFGSRDMVYLLALRSINRYLPWLRHYSEAAEVHPWHLYGILRQIVGDLSCFSEGVSVLGETADNGGLPAYDPLNLYACFAEAKRLIVELLDDITTSPDRAMAMTYRDGVYSIDLSADLLDGSKKFYLALTSTQDAATLAQDVETSAKLSSRSRVSMLMSHALPGVPLEYVAVPPQELPRKKDVVYFAIGSHDESWAHVQKDRTLACGWEGASGGLPMNLVVVPK